MADIAIPISKPGRPGRIVLYLWHPPEPENLLRRGEPKPPDPGPEAA